MSSFNQGSQRIIQIKPVEKLTPAVSMEESLSSEQELAEQKRQQAEKVLEEAREEASQLLQAAEHKIDADKKAWEEERIQLVQAAEKEGYQAGVTQGYQDYTEKLEEANHIIAKANQSYHSIVGSSEETIVEIALRAAEKILNCHLEDHPESFSNLVKKVVKEVQEQPEIAIYVHPDQYGYLQSQAEELQRMTSLKTNLSIYVKDEMEPFSCVLETPFGRIDAGIDSQLKELREKVFRVVQEVAPYE
ncbi:flagellar assembly protein FliH [Halobacillus alkaliphilus]|uniref:Flagellar assembly protein FliH n=1 Tax=Halobacillus alkaliphilus TaxID=396056 RepID=A0A1I2KVR1_9BACI|nr:flagellar assembly protein FliH [Halobacillus alkaliphilus]SFF70438.1 flagellar assembly protein FliH [Halobacillus alkaliphilus]